MTTRQPVEYSVQDNISKHKQWSSELERHIHLIRAKVPDSISTRYGRKKGQTAQLYEKDEATGRWKQMYYSEKAVDTLLREQRLYTLEYNNVTGVFVAKLLPVRVSTPPNVPDVQD